MYVHGTGLHKKTCAQTLSALNGEHNWFTRRGHDRRVNGFEVEQNVRWEKTNQLAIIENS